MRLRTLKDENGNLIVEPEAIASRCQEYFHNLLNVNNNVMTDAAVNLDEETSIMEEDRGGFCGGIK